MGFFIFLLVVAGAIWGVVELSRRTAQAERERLEAQARARAEYRRRRAEFLANASPIEAQAFLIKEQTEAIVAAQRHAASVQALSLWLNGTNNPFPRR